MDTKLQAKYLLKNLLERRIAITIQQKCSCCQKTKNFKINNEKEKEGTKILLNHQYCYDGCNMRTIDVAYIIYDHLLLYQFEIGNTPRNSWEGSTLFNIDANKLISLASDEHSLTSLTIPCIQCVPCEECFIKNEKCHYVKYRFNNHTCEEDKDKYRMWCEYCATKSSYLRKAHNIAILKVKLLEILEILELLG